MRAQRLRRLLGGDRRASRAELRKLALYAHGAGRVELDDVMAVVADASALALDALIDAAFAGNLADVEKEFAKATIAGTNPSAIIGAALRQLERLHALSLEIASGASRLGSGRAAAVRNSFPPQGRIHQGAACLDTGAARARDVDARPGPPSFRPCASTDP